MHTMASYAQETEGMFINQQNNFVHVIKILLTLDVICKDYILIVAISCS